MLDQVCCAQEQACAANAACVDAVSCINACPAPYQDSCSTACASADDGASSGIAALEAVADCSKAAPAGDSGTSTACDWPN
jgi:hypothetical protein